LISPKELAQELSSFINNLSIEDAFSGSVLVAKGNDVIFTGSVGYANRTWKIKNNIDTKFSLGSMNKMFTAIAALQLIEKGKLKFDDKLIQFVDKDWLPKGDSDFITIRQLLTHTSGLGNFFNDEFNQSNKEAYRSLDAYKPLISQSELLFVPGSRNRYSNSGMLMLGLVIEKVSGQNYYDYVQQHIYNKANMPNSGSFELDSVTDNLASGYLKRMHSDRWVDSIYARAIKGSPAGGGFSSVSDLYQFAIALTEFRLLGKKLTEDAFTEKTQYNSAFWYGYGFSVSGEENNRIVGHGGAYLGVDSRLDIHLDNGFIVVILANQSDVVAPVRRKINELIEKYGS
jgi:CubicO group peptidase (beta-lactamase class C family)